ncbi:proton-conducting transporter transmembrane domain-containing protein [Trichloromonas sp.]|uniref:proton-conducting transporter transmembrane domain-containing protein n=1 Tax=Trichloromonas sp. TaxID=3069249 RepID=UPI003D81A06D
MSEVIASLTLLLVVIWPLLLAGAVSSGTTRPVPMRLVPWAALPALVTAVVLPEIGLQLHGTMLGGELVLDGTGRVFLLLSATLWLATGLLARPQLHTSGANRFAVLLLLAMAGGFGLALAGDAMLFFAAGTLAGYALYGLLVHDANISLQTAVRVLVVLLVLSDLLVFELLLILGQAAGSVDFMSLRQAWMNTDYRGVVLGLLIVGFGIKAGVVGVHFWLAPVFVNAGMAVRPALVSFMLGAGLLGWLRLLPIGDIHWSGAGVVLQWLAWFTLGYAVLAGQLKAHPRAVQACTAIALTGLWVAMLGAVLLHPQPWSGMAEAAHATILQSGFALAALLLLDRRTAGNIPKWLHPLPHAVKWLAALQLATVPVAVTVFLSKDDGFATVQMSWTTAAIAFLVVRSLLLSQPASHGSLDMKTTPDGVQQPMQAPTATAHLVAGGLTAAGLLAAAYNLVELSPINFGLPVLMMMAASLAAWLSVKRRVPHLPDLPLLVPISNGLAAALRRGRRLADRRLQLWRDAGRAQVERLWSRMGWGRVIGRFESRLNHWPTTLVILAALGLFMATLVAIG